MNHTAITRSCKYLTCALFMALCAKGAFAWTDKPVRMIVPAPPGGTMDTVARIVADELSAQIGQPVVVDNKPGASGSIAVRSMLSSPPDGRTILLTASNVLTEVPHVLNVGFDPLKDVKPVVALARGVMVFVGSPGVPARDVKGVVAWAKANPGKLGYASYSSGTASHYAGAMFNKQAGLDLTHVPFPGSVPALTQVMGGQVPLMFDGVVTSKPLIAAGKIKVFGVASKTRWPQLPNVPTLAEQGYPDIDFKNWTGVVVPAKVSPELTEKIHVAVSKAAATPKVHDRLVSVGFEPMPDQPAAQLANDVRVEFERNARIVKSLDIKAD
ncbi:tripartite tricarboxylate transporter substrate binding protein [Cupriavidus sp. UYPR2.512]|uniref:Bug family tripartite tricarboxylate transporter substrate binding protein n=1 Tax=Cupriavidus sp. UYPR2.512 TaxID=1080187 RepID=UPI0003771C6E|nr:tripartite tricarboxylate transporter substrate binding protein [Cupriavidus sp. UYPR2.512]UIF84704.1 tripartite tricarboxylate transporter substrate binding protein [Cupriavidus necator]